MHAIALVTAAACAALLAGCSSMPASMNPVDWWHAMEGGKVAEQRPPPPNADAPYPGLNGVPPRPVPTDAATRGRIASGLVADRANAQYVGAVGADPSSPRSAPQTFGRGTAPLPPAAGSDTPSASLLAATAPPAAAHPVPAAQPPLSAGPPPRAAPMGRVDSAPLAPPPATAAAADAASVTIPAAPPPAPRIAGVEVPAVTAPAPPPVAPVVPAAPAPTSTPGAVLVPFAPGSAEIAADAQDALRALAQRRGAAPLQAIGYGEAPAGETAAQSAALVLALARARAIAAVLMASGVPSSLVQVEATAEGHGGAARIAN